jgi:predicted transcriptional regulator
MTPPEVQKRLLENEIRRNIFSHIKGKPGAHLRQIQRDLDIPLGTLEYHLHQLVRHEMLVTRDDHRFKAYFPKDGMGRRDRDVLYYLRQEMPRKVALLVTQHPGITFRDLAAMMPISGSTTSFHLKKLVKAGIVTETRVGREKMFEVPDHDRIRRLVIRYRKSFVDDVVDRFSDAWMDIRLDAPV